MKLIITSILIFLISFTTAVSQENTQDVEVKIVNFESDKGHAMIGLYDSEKSFMKLHYLSSISKIENNECIVTFKNVPTGMYAISLFHDENDNGKLDTNMFGIPKEDYGSSNNAKGFLGPPKWNDAKFEVTNKPINLNIKL